MYLYTFCPVSDINHEILDNGHATKFGKIIYIVIEVESLKMTVYGLSVI